MKRNIIKQHIQSLNLPLRMLFVFGILSILISCEIEDDIPPPSAYVEPEPVEGCVYLVAAPTLADGIDFECSAPEINTFGDDEGSLTVEPADNPFKEGINTSDKVMMVTQTAGLQPWAGFFFDMTEKVDFSENQTIKVKVYSPAAGQNVNLKLEDSSDGTIAKEVTMTTTVAEEWEEISFAFSPSDSDKFDRLVLFFDFNGDKDATTVHYFDDIVLAAGGGGTVASTTSFPVNFETPANGGAAENWSVFENVDNPALEIISNPDASGANTSATVAQFTARKDGQAYAGTITQLTTPFTLSAANSTVKILVWKTVISDVAIKFENAAGGSTGEIKVANTKTNEWEELTFDFSGVVGDPNNTDITGLIVFPDFNDSRTQDNVVYFDNITLSGDGTSGGTNPTASAPTPTDDAGNVQSIFSDAYTDPAGINYYPDWGQSTTFEMLDFDGNEVIKYGNANYQGIDFGEALDLTSYTTLKIDVWSGDYTSIPIFLISAGSGEKSVSMNVTPNQWNTIEIPLADFTSQGLDISDIIQIKFDVQPDTGGSFYIDNLYFSNETGGGSTGSTATSFPVDFETAANGGAAANWSVFENVDNPALEIISNPDMTGNSTSTVAQFTARQGGQAYAGTITQLMTPFTLDASNSIVKVWVWKSVISDVGIKFENGAGGSTGEIKVANTKTNEWEELTFDFSGVIGDPNNTDITGLVVFPDFQDRAQENVVYFDNITLNSSTGGGTGGGSTTGTLALPLDFDGSEDYVGSSAGVDFNVVTNPQQSGINATATKVGEVINAGNLYEALTISLDNAINFSGSNKTITMKIYSETAYPVLFKLETGVNGERANEVQVNHTGSGWEELTFNFATDAKTSYISDADPGGATFVPTGQYATFSIFLDFAGTTSGTFYIDDIKQN